MFSKSDLYLADVSSAAQTDIDWRKLQGSGILVTGATGLIGTFLIDTLMYRNERYGDAISLYAVGRNRRTAEARFGCYFDSPHFHFVEQDIQKTIAIDAGIDYIIHGASNAHPVAYAEEPIGTIMTSIAGTKNVLDFAAVRRVKGTLFLSTVEIYGENRGDVERFTEDYCGYINCNTLRAGYPEGKRAAEALCQAYIKEKKLDIIVARCCRVYGPTMTANDSKAIAQFLRNAAHQKNIVLKSAGEQRYSYCYVADVCAALLTLLTKGASGEAYNVAGSRGEMSLREIAALLAEAEDGEVVFAPPPAREAAGYSKASTALLDSGKLRGLGWEERYGLREGLLRTVEMLRKTEE